MFLKLLKNKKKALNKTVSLEGKIKLHKSTFAETHAGGPVWRHNRAWDRTCPLPDTPVCRVQNREHTEKWNHALVWNGRTFPEAFDAPLACCRRPGARPCAGGARWLWACCSGCSVSLRSAPDLGPVGLFQPLGFGIRLLGCLLSYTLLIREASQQWQNNKNG